MACAGRIQSLPGYDPLSRTPEETCYPMGIITQNLDTDAEFRDHALRINAIGEYFSVVATSESIGYDKPDPRLFLGAADRTGFSPESILHVGDKVELDVAGAEAAGMQAVLIATSGCTK